MAEVFERTVGLGDIAGTRAEVSVDEEGELTVGLLAGHCGGRGFPTPEALRMYAAACLDAVEEAERIRRERG